MRMYLKQIVIFLLMLLSVGCDEDAKPKADLYLKVCQEMTDATLENNNYIKYNESILDKKTCQKNKNNSVVSEVMADTKSLPIIVETPSPIIKKTDIPFVKEKSQDDSQVGIKVIDKRFTSSTIYITLLLRNYGASSENKRLHILGYDKNGRLISSKNSRIYFRAAEQYMLSYSFSVSSGITRWVFDLR